MKKLFALFIVLMIDKCNCIFSQSFWDDSIFPPDGRTKINCRSVGIGNFTLPPQARLHVNSTLMGNDPPASWTLGHVFRTDGNSIDTNIWQLFTVNGTNNPLEIGAIFVPADSFSLHIRASDSRGILYLKSHGDFERMRLTEDNTCNDHSTRVSISYDPYSPIPITQQTSVLNLGYNPFLNGGGDRRWMQIGVFSSELEGGHLFVGLRHPYLFGDPYMDSCKLIPSDVLRLSDAIINWGDESSSREPNLRFTFTKKFVPSSSILSETYDGQEIAIMTPEGNMGIGSYYNYNQPPIRRLDIQIDTEPQLRLTNVLYSGFTGGKYTDFECTSLGDLIINPIANGATMHVGINLGISPTLLNPTQDLDVLNDGRFRNMPLDTCSSDWKFNFVLIEDPNSVEPGKLWRGPSYIPGGTFVQCARNGLRIDTSCVELGDYSPSNNWDNARLLHNSYIPLNNKNIIFYDPTILPDTITPHHNLFIIGKYNTYRHYVYSGGVSDSAKFTVNNFSEECTGFLGSNCKKTLAVLDVNHSNSTWESPSAPFQPVSHPEMYGIRSHIAQGTDLLNIGIYSIIDSTQTQNNIAVKGIVKSQLINNQQSESLINIGGEFGCFSPVGTSSKYNIGGYTWASNSEKNHGINSVAVDSAVNCHQNIAGSFYAEIQNTNSDSNNIGIISKAYIVHKTIDQHIDTNIGGWFIAKHNLKLNIGGLGQAYGTQSDTTNNYGLIGEATDSLFNMNIGVYGFARADIINNNLSVGVYGDSYPLFHDTANHPNTWAGYFRGCLNVTGTIYSGSDSIFKNNVLKLDSALDLINKLMPKSYYFNTKKYPYMSFSNKKQYGLFAEDVEKNLPELTTIVKTPEVKNKKGTVIEPSIKYKAINYIGFIPILIQGEKELKKNNDSLQVQNDKIQKSNDILTTKVDSLSKILNNFQAEMNNLASVLSECCKNKTTGMNDEGKTDINSTIKIVSDNSINNNKTELYQNIPNPFHKITTFTYLLGTEGYVELEITNQMGQLIKKLINMNQETGNYSIDWDSANVSSGIYFYSLKVNSLLLVKKAIKIN